MEGILVRTVANQRFEAGAQAVTWDGRASWGKLVFGGRYVIRVTATNELGVVSLEQQLTVRRTA
jgi:flagellar hook assembly protein FlgD